MAFVIESTFPPAENFRHFDAITSSPYTASYDFRNGINDPVMNKAYRKLFGEFVQMNSPAEISDTIVQTFKQETVQQSNTFRDFTWHLDGFSFKEASVLSTVAPTEIVQVLIEYLPREKSEFLSKNPIDAHLEEIIVMNDALERLKNRFGWYWLEEAGELMEAPAEKLERMSRVARVSNLAIAQVMPCVVMTGDLDTTLHRSAKWQQSKTNPQPKERGFGRAFSGLLVPTPT